VILSARVGVSSWARATPGKQNIDSVITRTIRKDISLAIFIAIPPHRKYILMKSRFLINLNIITKCYFTFKAIIFPSPLMGEGRVRVKLRYTIISPHLNPLPQGERK
jgi:hypothetical protein